MGAQKSYLIHMAGIAAVDLGFTFAFLLVAGQTDALALALGLNVVILIGVNFTGALWLIQPIVKLEKSAEPGDLRRARRRLAGLRRLSTLWAAVLGLIYCGAIAASGVFVADPSALLAVSAGEQLAAVAVFFVAYAALFAFYAYFAVGDCQRRLRETFERERGVAVRGPRSSLGQQLFIAFAGLAVAPALLILAELKLLEAFRVAQGIGAPDAILIDLLALLIAAAISFVFIRRAIAGPVADLTEVVDDVAAGRLVDAPIPMDDTEIGRLAVRFGAMLDGLRERERIRAAFGRYVSPPVAAAIMADADPENGRLPGELKLATVMFTDIEGFTSLSERIAPSQLIEILNVYFEIAAEPIAERGGLIGNFIGDAILAVFNVPQDDPDHARHAVEAALEIQDRIAAARFPGGYRMPTRIGIHTGPVVAGSVGSRERLAYSVFGDTVNAAARLEAMNKTLGSRILMSEATASLAGGAGAPFHLEPLGAQKVRGRASPLNVFTALPRESAEIVSFAATPGLQSVPLATP